MTNNNLKRAIALGAAFSMAAPASVFATNGMFLIASGTKSRGMGGVSMTMTHDTLTSAINPATMAHTGNRFDIGGDIFVPTAESTIGQDASKYTEESKTEHFTIADSVYVMPNMGASWNDGDLSYGFTMVGVGGGGSQYNYNIYNNLNAGDTSKKLGVSLLIMNMNPTIAMKLSDQHSVGATLIIGVQVFKAYGLDQFTQFTLAQDSTAKFTDEGAEVTYGAGIRLGYLGKFMDGALTLGAAYTSETDMKEFDKYKDLFAEQGDMDTPGNIGIGAAYNVNNELTVAMDITYTMYEDVAAVSNPGPDPFSATPFAVDRATNALGADEGLGFGWENQTVFKLGAIYQYNEKWTLRGGWNYGKSPIDERTEVLFNIVAPATTEHHLTMGASYQYDKDIEFSFSYVHAFENEQFGPTYIGYEGEIGMSQDSVGATFAMKF